MATLYVAEFESMVNYLPGGTSATVRVLPLPPLAEQTVDIGSASAQSEAFSDHTWLIRVTTDTACSIAVGKDPTATTDNLRLAADQTEYFGVAAGTRIAVIANAGGASGGSGAVSGSATIDNG